MTLARHPSAARSSRRTDSDRDHLDDERHGDAHDDGRADERRHHAYDDASAIAASIADDATHPWGDPTQRRALDVMLPLFERDLALPSGTLEVATDATSARVATRRGAPAVATQGRICVADDAPRADSARGKEVIAHEAIHIAQMHRHASGGATAEATRDLTSAETEASGGARALAAGRPIASPAVALAPSAIAAFEESCAAPAQAAMNRALGVGQAFANGHDRLREERRAANNAIEALAGDEQEPSLLAEVLIGAISTVIGAVTGGLSGLVTSRITDVFLKPLVTQGLARVMASVNAIATRAAGSALASASSDETKRRLFFLGVDDSIRAEVDLAARTTNEQMAASSDELPDVAVVADSYAQMSVEAKRLQLEASRRAWLACQARAALGPADPERTPTWGMGEAGGTALRTEASAHVVGVMQVEVAPDLHTIVKAELPGNDHMQDAAMHQQPLREVGIPVRFQVGKSRNIIMVNENGAASFSGEALRAELYRLGGGPLDPAAAVADDESGNDTRPFIELGLRRVVADLTTQRLGSKLPIPPAR